MVNFNPVLICLLSVSSTKEKVEYKLNYKSVLLSYIKSKLVFLIFTNQLFIRNPDFSSKTVEMFKFYSYISIYCMGVFSYLSFHNTVS